MRRHALHGFVLGVTAAVGLAVSASLATAADEQSSIECKPPTPCMMTDVGRVLRVLPRPQSNIYADQSTKTVVEANVPAFSPLIALDRVDVSYRDPKNPTGWYKVGLNRDTPKGWMQAKDLLEWKQALVVSYSHPGIGARKRKPVLMFDDRRAAEDALLDSAGAPALYSKLEKGEVPSGVISREPDRFIDIKKNFYLLPIIDYVALSKDSSGFDGRILQVAAAVPNRRARTEDVCTTDRRDFRECIRAAGGRGGESLTVDVVYVVDLTGSMQPFVDATADSMRESAQKFAEVAGSEDRIKFGFIGFRDSVTKLPANEFVTKNFTPRLVERRQFAELLRNAVAKEGGDIPEAVYAGIKEGLDSKWNEKSVKLMVLIGDASSHEPSDPDATSPYSAAELRRFADDKGINVAAIYIKNPRQRDDWAIGIDQFKTLSTNPGGTIAFFAAESDPEAIKQTIFQGTALMVDRVRELMRGGEGGTEAGGATVANPVAAALEGGLVVYLGSGAEPPRDITAWMSDRDLSNPDLRSLDVNVLVHRSDLDTLTAKLEALMDAYRAMDVTGQSWFQNLRTLPTLAAVDQLKLSTTLANSPLVPRWINGLPYKSDLLSLTFEEFESLGGSERQAMVERIEGLIRTYKQFQASDGWVALQAGDPPAEHVFPLPLSALP